MRKFLTSRGFLVGALGALALTLALIAAIFALICPLSVSPIISALFPHSVFADSAPQTLRAQDLTLPPLEVGDLIFRRGDSLESMIISRVSHHHYTHLGLILSTDPLLIIHATTDDNPTAQNQVIISPLDEFLSHARSLAIKRLPLTRAQKDSIALSSRAQLGREFVIDEGSQALYCTTFVESVLAPHIALNLIYDDVNLPTWQGKYLFPRAFFELPQGNLMYEKRL